MEFEQLKQLERINVVGTSGSGKTTFARQLAEMLQLPCYEMDQLFWKADWQMSSDEELLQKVRGVTSRRRWVLDGNYTRTTPDKWKQVQLVIWLDLSLPRTVFRVTKRAFHRSRTQEELWPGTGNRESLKMAFLTKESIIWWAITSFRRNRNQYRAVMDAPEYSHVSFVRLRSPRAVASFLEGMRRGVEKGNGRPVAPGVRFHKQEGRPT